MFISLYNLFLCYLLTFFIQTVNSATPCVYDVGGQKQLDIRTLGLSNGKGPKYDNIPTTSSIPKSFSWNGCFDFSKTGAGDCKDAAACFTTPAGQSTLIAKQNEVQFEHVTDDVNVLVYHHNDILLTVVLTCRDSPEDSVRGHQDDPKIYRFELQSRCCCPGKCQYASDSGSLSGGSVFIIILVVLLFVYIVGGMGFLRFARGATGTDMIPHRLLWVNILLHAIDGLRYTIQVIRQRSFSVEYQKI